MFVRRGVSFASSLIIACSSFACDDSTPTASENEVPTATAGEPIVRGEDLALSAAMTSGVVYLHTGKVETGYQVCTGPMPSSTWA